MASAVMDRWLSMTRLCRPDWWAGPIFQKELRVASRRRRSYLLRCAYVLLLTMYIAMVWVSAVSFARSGAMSRAQMQVAAHTITQGIVWFQFFGAQAVVLLLMSTAISEEVYHRTLGVLMTTPLSSHQVVRNKFFSRLFQVLLLVGASLPLLAVVRVLGGIAWSYVIVSLCVTAATVIFVGSVSLFFSALCRAMGEPVLLDRLRRGRFRDPATDPKLQWRPRNVRRVVGPPMIWKELTCTLSSREKFVSHTVLGVEITLILIAYMFPIMMSVAPYEFLHLAYVWGFLGVAVLLTITASASVISTEKESRTWPLLLLTPLTDRELLLGKLVGVLRRCGPVWLSLLAYVAGFAYARCFHPLAIAQVTIIILSTLLFLTAAGFYFGSRLRRATEAVTANLVLAGVLWCVAPILGAVAESGLKGAWNGGESVAYSFIPFAQAFALVATTLDGYYGDVGWFGHSLDAGELIRLMLVSMVGYLLVALLFAWRAVRGFRRRML